MHTDNNFSFSFREKQLDQLQHEFFDLLIIGGGITGAGIALDAINRGLKVALIEKNDFASGTSSRSTKLVHGGLRYLQQLQFKFVVQLGRERKILHCNNANNIIPTPMLLPIYKHGKLKKNLSLIALKIYDKLAGVPANFKTQWINKTLLVKKYPFIKTDGLKGALLYYEYKTNDGRMVIEMLKKASQKGLYSLNYMEANAPITQEGKIIGISAFDVKSGNSIIIRAKSVVNASGAWCGKLLDQFNLTMPKQIHHTKGVHIVISKDELPIKEAFYFDTADNRMIFAIPKLNHIYIGTTDTDFNELLDKPSIEEGDINYLLKAIKDQFPQSNIEKADIESGWAGLRSLIRTTKNKMSEISRKEELFVDANGLISITGGKLTGYRLMAEKVVDLVFQQLRLPQKPCSSKNINFSGSEWENCPSVDQLIEIADNKFDEAKQTGIQPHDFKLLFYRYGTNIDLLIEKAYELMNSERDPELLWLKAEVWYAVHYEMVGSLSSFFIYRTEMILFDREKVEKYKVFVANEMGKWLNWEESTMKKQIEEFESDQSYYRAN